MMDERAMCFWKPMIFCCREERLEVMEGSFEELLGVGNGVCQQH